MVEEVMGAWRQLHNVELHNLYSSFFFGGGGLGWRECVAVQACKREMSVITNCEFVYSCQH